jgi:hypothetical protein
MINCGTAQHCVLHDDATHIHVFAPLAWCDDLSARRGKKLTVVIDVDACRRRIAERLNEVFETCGAEASGL